MRTIKQYRVICCEHGKRYLDVRCGVTTDEEHARQVAIDLQKTNPLLENVYVEHRTAMFSEWER